MIGRLALRSLGLGVVAGAVLLAELPAQDTTRTRRDTVRTRRDTTLRVPIPPQADTIVRRDSVPRTDSIARARLARLAADTIKAPLARAEMPVLVETARAPLRWDRDSLFATGALSVMDLLERVPGLTAFRAGWVSTPALGAYLGNLGRIRIFYDGIELDPLDPRLGGLLDLTVAQAWTAEAMTIEQGADEVRIHIRSWRVQRTTPYTRADVGTGDQETNLYRGFFGQRFQRGEALQVSAQQVSTTPGRFPASSGNEAAVHARVGWAKNAWSVDATLLRVNPDRGILLTQRVSPGDTIVPAAIARTTAYVRFGYGDPDRGLWAQLIYAGRQHDFTGQRAPTTEPEIDEPVDADTTRFQTQLVAAGGITWRGVRLTATERYRAIERSRIYEPIIRASYSSRLLSAAAIVEARGVDASMHADAMLRVSPLPFVAVGGAIAFREARPRTGEIAGTTARLEAAVRLGALWLGGGAIQRDSAFLPAPVVFSRRFAPRDETRATGAFLTIRGRLWGPFYANAFGIQWRDSSGFYRPKYQTRSELYVATTLPRRFPSGNFGLLASLVHEYRSHTLFPTTSSGVDRVGGFRQLSGLVEIRILDAILTYQYRNLLVADYATVPGYFLPRQTQFYGVRWTFWN